MEAMAGRELTLAAAGRWERRHQQRGRGKWWQRLRGRAVVVSDNGTSSPLLTPEEAAALAKSGVLIAVYNDTASISLTPEAESRLAKDAARLGLDAETHMRVIRQKIIDRALKPRR